MKKINAGYHPMTKFIDRKFYFCLDIGAHVFRIESKKIGWLPALKEVMNGTIKSLLVLKGQKNGESGQIEEYLELRVKQTLILKRMEEIRNMRCYICQKAERNGVVPNKKIFVKQSHLDCFIILW